MSTIILLHGWTQTGAVLEASMVPLASALRVAGFSLVFPNAPHTAGPGHAFGSRTWWDVGESDSSGRVAYNGWDVSRAALAVEWGKAAEAGGVAVGLLGFSQGAVVVHTLLEELAAAAAASHTPLPSSSLSPFILSPPRFAILACGFPSRQKGAFTPPTQHIATPPTLHAIARRDKLVEPKYQHALASRFLNPTLLDFDAGHRLPSAPADIEAVVQFCLRSMNQ